MSKTCPVCQINLKNGEPELMPCGIAPRAYVEDTGIIKFVVPGCPFEPDRLMDFVSIHEFKRNDELKLTKPEIDHMNSIKRMPKYEDYQILWASGHGENVHLNFDPRKRLEEWRRTARDCLPKPH